MIRYSRQIIHFLQEQKVKAIVVACNTASAFALDAVKDELDIPILGVIEAGAKVAAQETRNKRGGHYRNGGHGRKRYPCLLSERNWIRRSP